MILQALVDQFKQRFQHEKRAQVCLWFDEKEEFVRLLPSFRAHLESMRSPPFRVLEYDVGQRHGQIWLKYQVNRTLDALPEDERQRQRFLIYLPLSEDRIEDGSCGARCRGHRQVHRHPHLFRGGQRPPRV